MSLSSSGDPGAFPFDYRTAIYSGSGGIDFGNTGFEGCDAAEMGYGVDIGVGVSGFGEGPLLRYTQYSGGAGFGL
jgi:hypothetical protein